MASAASVERPRRVIVIGGGIVGLSTAYYLAKRGCAVTVFERDEIGIGASAGNAGLIALGHPPIPRPGVIRQTIKWMFDSTSPLYIPLRFEPALLKWLWQFRAACGEAYFKQSMEILSRLGRGTEECLAEMCADASLGESAEYHTRGQIEIFKTPKMHAACLREAELLRGHGFEIEEWSADELHTQEPAYFDDVIGALVWRDSAFAHPGKFVLELADRVRQHGGTICASEAVTKIIIRDRVFIGVSTEKHPDDILEADALVLAAGIWSTKLAATVGVNIPMQAAKGYHINLSAPAENIKMAGVLKETFVAVNPIEGCLRIAGTLEFSGINNRIMRSRMEMLLSGARKYIRGLDQVERISEWHGFRPCTADGLPAIGQAPGLANVQIATGHAMMGFALGPITGKLVSEMLLDGKPALEIGQLAPNRF